MVKQKNPSFQRLYCSAWFVAATAEVLEIDCLVTFPEEGSLDWWVLFNERLNSIKLEKQS